LIIECLVGIVFFRFGMLYQEKSGNPGQHLIFSPSHQNRQTKTSFFLDAKFCKSSHLMLQL
jgi:hypothetical protein